MRNSDSARRDVHGHPRAPRRKRPYDTLGDLLIRSRVWRGLTQGDVARLMGTSTSAIARLESGCQGPNIETLGRLGNALGMKLIVGFEDESGERELIVL